MSKLNDIENEFEKSINGFSKNDMLMGLIELINIKYILNYEDIRSVKNWCKKHNVFIFKIGNKSYVNKFEFILSFYKKFINHLKANHKNWKALFIGFVKGNLNEIIDSIEDNNRIVNQNKYIPNSVRGNSFLSKMKKL